MGKERHWGGHAHFQYEDSNSDILHLGPVASTPFVPLCHTFHIYIQPGYSYPLAV